MLWSVPASCCSTETNSRWTNMPVPAVPTHTGNISWNDKAFLECISGFHTWKTKEQVSLNFGWMSPRRGYSISGTAAQFAPHIQRQTRSTWHQKGILANRANGKKHRVNVTVASIQQLLEPQVSQPRVPKCPLQGKKKKTEKKKAKRHPELLRPLTSIKQR